MIICLCGFFRKVGWLMSLCFYSKRIIISLKINFFSLLEYSRLQHSGLRLFYLEPGFCCAKKILNWEIRSIAKRNQPKLVSTISCSGSLKTIPGPWSLTGLRDWVLECRVLVRLLSPLELLLVQTMQFLFHFVEIRESF